MKSFLDRKPELQPYPYMTVFKVQKWRRLGLGSQKKTRALLCSELLLDGPLTGASNSSEFYRNFAVK